MKSIGLRKLLAVSLASACIFAFAGCSNGSSTSEGKNSSSSSKEDSFQTTSSSSKAGSSKEQSKEIKYIQGGSTNFPVQLEKKYTARPGTSGVMISGADGTRFIFGISYLEECDDVEKAYDIVKKDLTGDYYSFFNSHCNGLSIEKQEHYKNKYGLDILKVRGKCDGGKTGKSNDYYGFYTLVKNFTNGKQTIACCIGIPTCAGGDEELTQAIDYIAENVKPVEDEDVQYNPIVDNK